MKATTFGLNILKRVFQIYGVDTQMAKLVNSRFLHEQLIEFLTQRPTGHVSLESLAAV